MKVWRVRIRPRGGFDRSRAVRVSIGFVPTRGAALRALAEVKGEPSDGWPVEAILGCFIERYEERFKRRWGFTADATRRDLNNLELLVKRVGADEAHSAVLAIFSARLKWVTGNFTSFLANKDTYEQYVVPSMQERKDDQEQGQWRGKREGVSHEAGDEFWGS